MIIPNESKSVTIFIYILIIELRTLPRVYTATWIHNEYIINGHFNVLCRNEVELQTSCQKKLMFVRSLDWRFIITGLYQHQSLQQTCLKRYNY